MSSANGTLPAAANGDPADEGINVLGLISVIVFYLAVLAVGLWAGWKQRKERREMEARGEGDQSVTILAGRNIGPFVGVLTMGGGWLMSFLFSRRRVFSGTYVFGENTVLCNLCPLMRLRPKGSRVPDIN